MKAYLVISGNVQGVGYRAHAKRAAHQHHVRGFVRNRHDGTVDVFALYDKPEQLQAFIRELDRKSESFIGIHVDSIEVFRPGELGFKDDAETETTAEFQIRF
ncbi:acylphosphatase [Candidatus Micrarchaeota archaeon]|nr:acylphosphatase [Candidatus Micrarchaeota archaeon]